jgi:RNA polymerase sigma-70 factor (ECF subfamily)
MAGPHDEGFRAGAATSVSLLVRVKARDEEAWQRLVTLYTPLIYHWCRASGLAEDDAVDAGQEVFAAVAGGTHAFEHDPARGTFRGWLRVITQNKIRELARHKMREAPVIVDSYALAALAELPAEPRDEAEEEEYQREQSLLCWRVAEIVRTTIAEKTWTAFWRVVIEEDEPGAVAADLKMTINAVYKARVRIVYRLRQELAGLIDSGKSTTTP